VTQVLRERVESQVSKAARAMMEKVVELDCLEHLVLQAWLVQWVLMVRKEKRVILVEMEPVEIREPQVIRVNEVPGEKLANQVHLD